MLTAIMVFAACNSNPPAYNQDQIDKDFIITNLKQVYDGSPKIVNITPKRGKSKVNITVYYDSSIEAPTKSGSYTVTFDVNMIKDGINVAKGLLAGTMVVYIDSAESLGRYLDGFGTTSISNPVTVSMILDNLKGLNDAIKKSGKHINLDFSYSTELTGITNEAFNGCDKLISVSFPDTITTIGTRAFYDTGLTKFIIPSKVTKIEKEAFSYCRKLTTIEVDSANTAFSSLDGALYIKDLTTLVQVPAGKSGVFIIPNSVTTIGDNAISHCSNLTGITIPESVTSIGNSAFWNCYRLTSITIPDTVTSIGRIAFGACHGLTNITIPNNVNTIGDGAFAGINALTDIFVSSNNTFFCSVDGVLYDKNIKKLVQVPSRKSGLIKIPITVTSIADQAFRGCSRLTNITIPLGITGLGWYTFDECRELTSVTIEGMISSASFSSDAQLPGDLRAKYLAESGGMGTYTRPDRNSNTWTMTAKLPFEDKDFTMIQINNGRGLEIHMYIGSNPIVLIPPKSGNLPVTYISTGSFMLRRINKIIIPSSITVIEGGAFSMTPITEITIGANVKIGGNMILHGITVSMGEAFTYGFDAFYNSTGRKAGTYTYSNERWTYKN